MESAMNKHWNEFMSAFIYEVFQANQNHLSV